MEEALQMAVEIFTPALQQLAVGVVGIILVWLGRKFGKVLDTKIERDIVSDTVQWVEMVAGRFGWTSEQKKTEAIAKITKVAAEKGIHIKPETIEMLIEMAVKQFKYGFGEIPAGSTPPQE